MNVTEKDYQKTLEERKTWKHETFQINHKKQKEILEKQLKLRDETARFGFENTKNMLKMINAPEHAFEMLEAMRYEKGIKFFRWINKETNHNFYLVGFTEKGISLVARNLNLFLTIRTCFANDAAIPFLGGKIRILDIENIYSFEKGEGYKTMKNIISFAKRHSLPVTLWTETEKNVKYFERYGFINHGRLGENNEFLMILHT